jgi:hypothetical protein
MAEFGVIGRCLGEPSPVTDSSTPFFLYLFFFFGSLGYLQRTGGSQLKSILKSKEHGSNFG